MSVYVYFASLRGDRKSNEDSHNITLGMDDTENKYAKINFYGIYDGHGGKFVSNFLSNHIHHFFVDKNVKYPLSKQYVNDAYNIIQNILFTKYEKKATDCGSTCLIVCHFKVGNDNYLNVLNTGDSRCVLCRNNLAIPLTKDHKPDWPEEYARIIKLGGQIKKDGNTYRINDLSVSRAFGDKESSKYVTHIPDIYKYKLKSTDRFMIIACDGLWDVMSSQDAVNFVLKNCYDADMKRINFNVNIAETIAQHAIEKESGDNITCAVVFFDIKN